MSEQEQGGFEIPYGLGLFGDRTAYEPLRFETFAFMTASSVGLYWWNQLFIHLAWASSDYSELAFFPKMTMLFGTWLTGWSW